MQNVHIGLVSTMEINGSAFVVELTGNGREHETEMLHGTAWSRNVLLFGSLF